MVSELTFIVTAGGIGKRMGSDLPKQFIEICGKPIIIQTIEQLLNFDSHAQLIVTLPLNYVDYFKDVMLQHLPQQEISFVVGGEERFHSIQNALKIANKKFVAVHDAVRPFVSQLVLQKLINEVKISGATIPVIEPKESLRMMNKMGSEAVIRSNFRLVQTPQVFTREILSNAYTQAYSSNFTDDSSVVEAIGQVVSLVQGNEENIKITSPLDLQLAEILLKKG